MSSKRARGAGGQTWGLLVGIFGLAASCRALTLILQSQDDNFKR